MAKTSNHPLLRLGFFVVMTVLVLTAIEFTLRYRNTPAEVISGWRTTSAAGPINEFGWRGRLSQAHRPSDFLVVLTGAGPVECAVCPRDETLDLMLENALRPYNPNARVVTLGSYGYGQDQEFLALQSYFARERADLIVLWTGIAEDVPANTFRTLQPRPGLAVLKPTFALRGDTAIGPTEPLGQRYYRWKLSALLLPLFIDVDSNWNTLLPPPDPGAAAEPPGAAARLKLDEPLEQQRSAWSIWLTPRPKRVDYGITLTRALLRQIRDLAMLRGARFTLLLTPSQADPRGTVALEHDGHWYLADPASRDAAVAKVTDGFDQIVLPVADGRFATAEEERQVMARLAEALDQRGLLKSTPAFRPRR